MKKTVATALLLSLAGAPSAAQQPQPAKMSPLVRSAAAACHQPRRQAPPAKAHYINAFVCADPAKADSLLAANGCRKIDASGDIFIVSIPTHRLNALSASPAVRRIEAARPCRAAMDTTASVINALPVYAGKGLPQAFTGRGVVVGVMDVGFDLTHPTFYDSTATTYRIGALWDMLDRDTIGSQLPVGRDYTGKDALLQKKHSTDGLMQTHGTHTLGIAAGSGHDSPYRGMAYESGICIVANAVSDNLPLIDSADVYKYTSATDALGFKYIFDYADSLGMPCVASFSEGATATYGTDDSLYCQYLGRLTGPGRIIVASAGNESVIARHVGKPAGKPQAGSFLCSGEGRAAMVVQADGPFCLRLLSYGFSPTDTVTVIDSPRMADSVFAVPLKLGGQTRNCTVSVGRYASAFSQPDSIYIVEIECDAPLNSAGRLAVVAEGTGAEVHVACAAPAYFQNGLADAAWADADISHNVLAPAYFPGVIAVGSTIHRTGFTNYLGQYCDYTQPGRNDGVLAYYSSVGPTMDGRNKPDVVAPGNNIVSSYSSFYEEHNPQATDINSDVAHFAFAGRTYPWNSNTGTSMAAPVVAGAIALWLQAKPDLTPEEALDALALTCRHPESGLAYPNNRYGHGEIDVHRGLLHLLNLDGIEGISTTQPQRLQAAVTAPGRLTLRFASAPAAPLSVRLYSTSGTLLMHKTIRSPQSSAVSIDVSQLPSGIYAVQTDSMEEGFTGSTLVRK